jgi:hypothetical protein
VGPPALNKPLGGCGLGDAEALLGADVLLVRAFPLRGGVFLVDVLLVGGDLVEGLLAGGGVFVGGLLVGGGVIMVVEGGLLAPLPTAAATGVSSLGGSS